MSKRILFLVPYPLHESPSQRFRFEQYFKVLKERGYRYTVQNFLNSHAWRVFYNPGRAFIKLVALMSGFAKRFIVLFKSPMYDFVFIHREAAPIGPPVFEWALAKIFRRKIIYDFDDAIWLTDRKEESVVLSKIKWRSKVATICRWSYKISCGNDYIARYAEKYNNNVVYNPTTIDTENLHNPTLIRRQAALGDKIRIGWTGSHSTLKYLDEIASVLKKILQGNSKVEFTVIADRPPVNSEYDRINFVPWNSKTEIYDLVQFDIGIMPLKNDEWSKGKCGFKALQYMALEIPTIASPVGVNTKIINHGINGLLCNTTQEWHDALVKLIKDSELRTIIGKNGRETVLNYYSVQSNTSNFLSLFA